MDASFRTKLIASQIFQFTNVFCRWRVEGACLLKKQQNQIEAQQKQIEEQQKQIEELQNQIKLISKASGNEDESWRF